MAILILFLLLSSFGILNGYDWFERNLPWQFPYAPNLICDVVEHAGMFYASVADAYSFQRSQAVAVWSSSSHLPEACFQYDGLSYIFFSAYNKSKTELLRNRENKTISLGVYEKLLFDGIKGELYIYGGNILRPVNLHELWMSAKLMTTDEETLQLDGRVLDLMVANGEVQYISVDSWLAYDFIPQRYIRRKANSKNLITQVDFNGEVKSAVSTNATKFDRIAVSMNDEVVKISALSLAIPKRPGAAAMNLWLALLYIIDIAFFLVLIYFIRIKVVQQKEDYYELKPIIV